MSDKINVVKLYDGVEFGVLAHGNHSKEEVLAAYKDDFGELIDPERMSIEHAIMRYIPGAHGDGGRYEYSRPGKGAFLATILWIK